MSSSSGASDVSRNPWKNSPYGNGALPARSPRHERGVEGEQHGGQVRGGVAVRDRTAERAAVPHLVVTHLGGHALQRRAVLRQDVTDLEVAVARERADGDVIAGVTHVREVAESPDIDDHRGRREPQLHERDERHPTREELGVVAMLGERGDRGVDGVGADVLERGGDHRALLGTTWKR